MTTPDSTDPALLSVRSALVLALAVLAAILTGGLTYWQQPSWPGAFLAAGVAFAGAVLFFNQLIK